MRQGLATGEGWRGRPLKLKAQIESCQKPVTIKLKNMIKCQKPSSFYYKAVIGQRFSTIVI